MRLRLAQCLQPKHWKLPRPKFHSCLVRSLALLLSRTLSYRQNIVVLSRNALRAHVQHQVSDDGVSVAPIEPKTLSSSDLEKLQLVVRDSFLMQSMSNLQWWHAQCSRHCLR